MTLSISQTHPPSSSPLVILWTFDWLVKSIDFWFCCIILIKATSFSFTLDSMMKKWWCICLSTHWTSHWTVVLSNTIRHSRTTLLILNVYTNMYTHNSVRATLVHSVGYCSRSVLLFSPSFTFLLPGALITFVQYVSIIIIIITNGNYCQWQRWRLYWPMIIALECMGDSIDSRLVNIQSVIHKSSHHPIILNNSSQCSQLEMKEPF